MKCIMCGEPDILDYDHRICDKCGFVMYENYCSNIDCVKNCENAIPCDQEAMFCDECGSKTLYNELGILKTT